MDAARKVPLAAMDWVRVVSFSTELPEVETFEDPSASEAEDGLWVSADGSGCDGEDDNDPVQVNSKLVVAADPGSKRSFASTEAEGSVGQGAGGGRANVGEEDERDGDDEGECLGENPFEGAVERRRIRRCATVGMGAQPDFELRSLPAASRLWQRRQLLN